jgi:hypothetical protein
MRKILHRIFFNFDNTRDPFLSYLETWKKELPDFEIMQWDKSNLPLDLNAYTKYMAETKNHAFLSDYFRCWLLNMYGGAYLDADIEVLDGSLFRKIYEEAQTTHDYTLFIGIESDRNGELTPHSMGVKCGQTHDMLIFLMNLYESVFKGSMRFVIKKFPIPDLISLYFRELEERENFAFSQNGFFYNYTTPFITNSIKIYPQDFFSPVTTYNNNMLISAFSKDTCLCHHFAATWKKSENNTPKKLFSNLLNENYYTITSSLISEIKKRYTIPNKPRRPSWSLNEKEMAGLEKLLNVLIPYGGILYSFLRKISRD